jgi:hypothetical protein
MSVPKMSRCPNCSADGSDVGAFGSYFYVYECSDCEGRFCHKCESSHNGHYCAHCGKQAHFREVGQIWKR